MRRFARFRPQALLVPFVLIILSFLGGCRTDPAVDLPIYGDNFTLGDCPFDGGNDLIAAGRVVCGTLTVPLYRDRPTAETLDLAVAVLRSHSPAPQPDPVIYVPGGPGFGVLRNVELWAQSPLLAERDFILLDQRGSGFSEPDMECPEYLSATVEALAMDTDGDGFLQHNVDGAMTCRDRLAAAGVPFDAFHSAELAADMEDLRLALGYDAWNLYSYSFGSHVALTLAYVDSAPIRSLIMDSPVPMDAPWLTEIPYQYLDAMQTVFNDCRNAPDCAAAFPTLEEDFLALLRRLSAEPVTIDLGDYDPYQVERFTLNDHDIHATLFTGLFDGQLIPYAPLMISELARGNETLPRAIAAVGPDLKGLGMRNSVLAYDVAPFNPLAAAVEIPDAPPEYLAGLPAARMELTIANMWTTHRADVEDHALRPLAVPTLIFTGEYDPLTPPSVSARLQSFLPNSKLYVLQGTSHRRHHFRPCFRDVVADFVAAPDRPVDDSCIADFVGPPDHVLDVTIVEGVYPFLTKLRYSPDLPSAGGLLAILAVFGLTFAGLPAYYIYRRFMLWPVPNWSRGARGTAWLLWGLSGVGLLYWGLLLATMVQTLRRAPLTLAFGLPGWAEPLLLLPYLLALLTVGALAAAAAGWGGGAWRRRWRAAVTLVAVTGVGCLVYIVSFGLYWGG